MTTPPSSNSASLATVFRGRNVLKFLLGLTVTALVVWALFRFVGGREALGKTLEQARWIWIWPGVLFLLFNLYLSAERWRSIVETMDFQLPLKPAFNAVMVTWPLSLFTPSRASDLLRAYLVRDRVPVWQGGGSVLAEKLIDVQSLCILAMLGSAIQGLWLWFLVALGLLVAEWFAVLFLVWGTGWVRRWPKLEALAEKIRRALESLYALARKPHRLLLVCFLSMLAWVGSFVIILSLLAVVNVSLPLTQIMALWPLAIFVGQLPLTLAGMGTRDLAFYSLLVTLNAGQVDKAAILTATFLYALVVTWFPAILGIPFVIRTLLQSRRESSRQEL